MSCEMGGNQAADQMIGLVFGAWKAAYPGAEMEFPNVANKTEGEAPSGPLWSRVTIRHADAPDTSLTGALGGRKRHTNIGVLTVQVFGPIGDGSTVAYDAAEVLTTALRRSNDIAVWFRRVRINEVGPRGTHMQINVLADFSYDDVR